MTYAELIDEARRRGVGAPESMDREALIDVLRGRGRERDRGALSRARSLLGRVVDTVRAALPGQERRSDRPPPPAAPMSRQLEHPRPPALPAEALGLLGDESLSGVRIVEDDALGVVWRVPPRHVERAQAIAPPGAEMHLVTVRVSWPPGAGEPRVLREDHGAVRSEGALALPRRAPGEKIVAAVALAAAGGEVVAIDHATHG